MAATNEELLLQDGPLAVNLANTLVSDRPGRDLLSTRRQLKRWLRTQAEWFRIPAAPGVRLEEFRTLREVVRDLFTAVVGGDRPSPRAIRELNRFAALAPTVAALEHRRVGFAMRNRPLVDDRDHAVMAAVAASAIELLAGPDRDRLRACLGPRCRLFFVAAHPARRWCDPRVCGNRVRVARHAERRRARRARSPR